MANHFRISLPSKNSVKRVSYSLGVFLIVSIKNICVWLIRKAKKYLNYVYLSICTALLVWLLFYVHSPIVIACVAIIMGTLATFGIRFLNTMYAIYDERVKNQAYYDLARQLAVNQREQESGMEKLLEGSPTPQVPFDLYYKEFFKNKLNLEVGSPQITENQNSVKYIFSIIGKRPDNLKITENDQIELRKLFDNDPNVVMFLTNKELVVQKYTAKNKMKSGSESGTIEDNIKLTKGL